MSQFPSPRQALEELKAAARLAPLNADAHDFIFRCYASIKAALDDKDEAEKKSV